MVNALDLRLSAGEVFGLLGPNGAGKTTTILMLLGLVEPTSGDIEVLGLDPARNPLEVKSHVGYLPDAVGFYDGLTGRENLRFTAQLNRISREEAENRIDALAGRGWAGRGRRQRRPGTYSRGMKQRLGIADALIKEPSILILDEPTTSIDPEGVAEMLGLIRRLADDHGVTILLSSHLLHQVQAVCDRVAIFVRGTVVAQGAPHELATESKGPEEVEVSVGADEGPRAGGPGQPEVSPEPRTRTDSPQLSRSKSNAATPTGWSRDLVEAGLPITSVRRVSEDLDEVYRRYFHAEEAKASV